MEVPLNRQLSTGNSIKRGLFDQTRLNWKLITERFFAEKSY